MRKQRIDTIYRAITAALPDLRCVVYTPDGAGGGIIDHGSNPSEHVDAAELAELTTGPNVLTVVMHDNLQNIAG